MTDSVREQIIQEIETTAGTLTVADGYHYDAGLTVKRVKRQWAEDECPAISIWDGNETVAKTYGITELAFQVSVDAHLLVTSVNASIMANRMLADIRKAFSVRGVTLSGLISSMNYSGGEIAYPDDSGGVVSIRANFDITYHTPRDDPFNVPS